ncbi:hypothetical protein [Microvirga aerophila]|uniref:Uncharacterized protein n=1 Tax=Microvirga aerophila TaxID=670291 RepID=A0A512BNY4_9HYPH|nr:hypothetical protein [Microvirga aerophila]GEO13663.1 hypothetical protein MAE02_13590 [Microvirga aerophila]
MPGRDGGQAQSHIGQGNGTGGPAPYHHICHGLRPADVDRDRRREQPSRHGRRDAAEELERAEIVTPGAIRPDVVTMHSKIEYLDNVMGEIRRITLVYPGEEHP